MWHSMSPWGAAFAHMVILWSCVLAILFWGYTCLDRNSEFGVISRTCYHEWAEDAGIITIMFGWVVGVWLLIPDRWYRWVGLR